MLLSTPIAKAQDTALALWSRITNGNCTCNGIHDSVPIHGCGAESDQHCSPSGSVICCLNPLISFQDHSLGNFCSGPRTPIALNGLPEGQQVYVRNCHGPFIAILVHHSRAAASGD
jgi:hypothetical protein